jgi:hypothetical protein
LTSVVIAEERTGGDMQDKMYPENIQDLSPMQLKKILQRYTKNKTPF